MSQYLDKRPTRSERMSVVTGTMSPRLPTVKAVLDPSGASVYPWRMPFNLYRPGSLAALLRHDFTGQWLLGLSGVSSRTVR